jgi:uncharacterized membrane protein HdeD (DUF308 family)
MSMRWQRVRPSDDRAGRNVPTPFTVIQCARTKGTNMNAGLPVSSARAALTDRESLREIWIFLVVMGFALIVLGCAAISAAFVASLATVVVFGLLLLASALVQVVTALWGRKWRGFFLHLLAGGLYFIAGMFMIQNPLEAVVGLSFLVAICLLAGGAVRIIYALLERFEGWVWVLLNGIISLLLGAAIWSQWPLSGLWVIGLFVGIEMLFSGISWVTLGLSVRVISTGKD